MPTPEQIAAVLEPLPLGDDRAAVCATFARLGVDGLEYLEQIAGRASSPDHCARMVRSAWRYFGKVCDCRDDDAGDGRIGGGTMPVTDLSQALAGLQLSAAELATATAAYAELGADAPAMLTAIASNCGADVATCKRLVLEGAQCVDDLKKASHVGNGAGSTLLVDVLTYAGKSGENLCTVTKKQLHAMLGGDQGNGGGGGASTSSSSSGVAVGVAIAAAVALVGIAVAVVSRQSGPVRRNPTRGGAWEYVENVPASAIVPGDQVVERDGFLLLVEGVEHAGRFVEFRFTRSGVTVPGRTRVRGDRLVRRFVMPSENPRRKRSPDQERLALQRSRLREHRGELRNVRKLSKAELAAIADYCRRERLELRDMREALGVQCKLDRSSAKGRKAERVQRLQNMIATDQAGLEAIQILMGGRRGGPRRATARERLAESDDEVRHNIDPQLVPVFNKVRRHIKASAHMSRTEAFEHWAGENSEEVAIILADQAERQAAREWEQLQGMTEAEWREAVGS